ncbi:MAG: isoleucine--tRNA ligase [Candidatus Microsyncoccus archaeolyticus]|nr:MAG: isoleucine--tRNA ligase [Candidatus Parcubacteria bacterium]
MINEEKILKYWEEKDIFHKSIKKREGSPYFSFYDGPPFATGKPHYGHILATTIKDAVLRYWTMMGYQVPRRVGWDCHGLPVENLIEKEMGIKNKKEIEEMGIEKFNDACRSSVFACVDDFESTLKRVGRWADYDKAYSTLENNYIESVWWVLKQLWDKNLVLKNYRVSPYCPRCGTTLSNFEVNQGYKEVKDKSIYVKFKIVDRDEYLLVWTTTPWTLPGNVALAVNPELNYVLVENNSKKYILAKERISILDKEYKIVKELKGKDLVGLKYEPMFDYLKDVENIENAFQVIAGDFVSFEDGTGIVHMNPMYGEDDFNIGMKYKLPFFHTVDLSGKFKEEVYDLNGEFVKDADEKIVEKIKQKDLLYKEEIVSHEYPYCWRCDSPLLYYAIESWYISVTKIKKELIDNNKQIHWVPEHIKEGRFGKWLEGARDWNFSRNRFWGAPIPIWECEECKELICIGSIEELEKNGGEKLNDLHLPYIDNIKFKCLKCGKEMKRTSGVFDCWFESGSMPYAQWHYPFENKDLVEKTFPADFIAEGLDQTRGWFYTLHVLSTALTINDIGLGKNSPAFKNVIVNGLILDEKGRKLSKKLKNYPDPKDVFDKYGADALRFFLLSSTAIGEDYRFSEDRVKEVWRKVISSIENCLAFYETYKKECKEIGSSNILDKWIVSRTEKLNNEIIELMNEYELTKASRLFYDYIDDLSNWYIRRSRKRFQKEEEASATLKYCLLKLSKLIAPFSPFIAEETYLKIDNSEESVHLCDYPVANKENINENLEKEMQEGRDIVNIVLSERSKNNIKVRQPLLCVKIKKHIDSEILELIKEEINVKEVIIDDNITTEAELNLEITPELKEEGMIRDIVRHIQQMRKEQGFVPKDRIIVHYENSGFFDMILSKNKDRILNDVLGIEFKKEDVIDNGKEILIEGSKIILKISKK